jgi:hypothetical protein
MSETFIRNCQEVLIFIHIALHEQQLGIGLMMGQTVSPETLVFNFYTCLSVCHYLNNI